MRAAATITGSLRAERIRCAQHACGFRINSEIGPPDPAGHHASIIDLSDANARHRSG